MPHVVFRTADGATTEVTVRTGTSVMQAAVNAGIDAIVAECGGQAMCATCHVFIDPAQGFDLPPLSEDEDALLDDTAAPRRPSSRLGCQVKILDAYDGMVIEVPDRQI